LGSKKEGWGAWPIKKFDDILAVWIQYTIEIVGRTERHRPTANIALTHSVACWW